MPEKAPIENHGGSLFDSITFEAPLSENFFVGTIRLHLIESFLNRIMQLGFTLAGGNAGYNLVEGLSSDIKHMSSLLQKKCGTLQGRSVHIDLTSLQGLASIGVLWKNNCSGFGFASILEFFILLLDQALDRCAVLHRNLET